MTPSPHHNMYSGVNQYRLYLNYRPDILKDMCWYTFVRKFEVRNSLPRKKPGTEQEPVFFYLRGTENDDDDHSEDGSINSNSNNTVIILRQDPAVVRISGATIRPSQRRDTEEKQNLWAMQMVLLFSPHTNISDFDQFENWTSALEYCRNTAGHFSDEGENFILNHQDHWDTTFASQEEATKRREKLEEMDEAILAENETNPEIRPDRFCTQNQEPESNSSDESDSDTRPQVVPNEYSSASDDEWISETSTVYSTGAGRFRQGLGKIQK